MSRIPPRTSDRRSILSAGLALSAFGASRAGGQTVSPVANSGMGSPPPAEEIDLWPLGAPGMPANPPRERIIQRSVDPLSDDRAVSGITRPRMVVFRPDHPNGAAVMLTPGGGFRWVVMDKEGFEMGRWLAARGFTAFVLFYRLPGEGWAGGPDVSLSDAQRAIRLIRYRARDYSLDPERVAAMGFSAGGHVCADLGVRFASPTYEATDAADQLSARPLCAAPIYPVVSMDRNIAHPGSRQLLLGKDPTKALEDTHSPDRNVPADAPPFFLLHAEDDDVVPCENAIRLRAAFKARAIPVETHLFAAGGHGFGLRKAVGKPVEKWPELWRSWARTAGLG